MDTKDIIKFLREQPIINAWPPSQIEELAAEIKPITIRKDQFVFTPEYQAEDAYIVYSGRVRQAIFSPGGQESWFRTCSPRDMFAQQALYRDQEYVSSAQATEATVVLRIPAPVFADLLIHHPELWSIIQNPAATRLQAIPLLRSLDDDQIKQLAIVTETKTFKAGEQICTATQADGKLWLIDWGQVKITDQVQGSFAGGRLTPGPPSRQAMRDQGIDSAQPILTAGNWFLGGQVKIPHQLSVTAQAVTAAKLIAVPGHMFEQLEHNFQDVRYMLRNRLDIAARLRKALAKEPAFQGLEDDHWRALATIAGWEHVPANLDVTRQGQYGTKLYALSDGAALVRATDDQGRERPRHLIRVGFQDHYGMGALVHGDRHGATVRSVVDTVEGRLPIDGSDWLTLQHDDVLYLLQSNPNLWRRTALWATMLEQPKEKKYRWQEAEEEIVIFTRQHQIWLWLRLGMVFLAALLLTGLLAFLNDTLLDGSLSALGVAMTMLILISPLVIWYVNDYLNDYYIITNRRILRHQRVFLIYENELEAPLERIQDITTRTSIIAKLLNYGWMTITTAGVGVIAYPMIPDPEQVEATIRALQGTVRAGSKAEQRENLRNTILKGLGMRLIPAIPARSLPEGTVPPVQKSRLQAFVDALLLLPRRFGHWLSSLPERIYFFTVGLLPRRTRERFLRERELRLRRRSAQMQEMVVYRKHIWFLIKAAAIPLAVIAITVILIVFTGLRLHELPSYIGIPYGIFLVICLFWLWFRIENWRNDKYILTKTHILDIYALPLGLFERRRQAEWGKVQNANYEVPDFFSNLLNFGTVKVETASVDGEIDFVNIPNPRQVQQEIVLRIGEARQAATQRERDQRQTDLSETLQIYNELLQEWAIRNRLVGNAGDQSAPPKPPPQTWH